MVYRASVCESQKMLPLSLPALSVMAVNFNFYCKIEDMPILFLYSDGGPDHRLTYVSVQASLIALFKNLDLDILCVARTAPYQSWRERIMSLLNMGLQSVGLMRRKQRFLHVTV